LLWGIGYHVLYYFVLLIEKTHIFIRFCFGLRKKKGSNQIFFFEEKKRGHYV